MDDFWPTVKSLGRGHGGKTVAFSVAAAQTVTVTIGQLGPDVFMEWEGSVSDLTVSAGTGLAPPSNFYIYQNYIASVNGAPLSDCKYCMYVVADYY